MSAKVDFLLCWMSKGLVLSFCLASSTKEPFRGIINGDYVCLSFIRMSLLIISLLFWIDLSTLNYYFLFFLFSTSFNPMLLGSKDKLRDEESELFSESIMKELLLDKIICAGVFPDAALEFPISLKVT